MVFSNTGHRTHNILEVVKLTDTVKVEKNLQVDNTGEAPHWTDPPATATTSALAPAEDFLKTEPIFESTMFHESDSEFFQDLGLWCSPDKEDQTKIIDVTEKVKERANTTTTPIAQFSPRGWEGFDAGSPHSAVPHDGAADTPGQEQFLDICKLPVVLGDLTSDTHLSPWNINTNTTPFIDQDDSLGYDPAACITWSDYTLADSNKDVEISEYVLEPSLRLNVLLPDTSSATDVSTPDVLRDLEMLDNEGFLVQQIIPDAEKPIEIEPAIPTDVFVESFEDVSSAAPSLAEFGPMSTAPSLAEYDPITPKTESHLNSDFEDDLSATSSRKRRHSCSSDDDYMPDKYTPRKYTKRKKQHVPLQDMIELLEGTTKTNTTRRGRPPKKRGEPTPDPSLSIQEVRYRELRDKNNEASKRSRMNRKLKELQMEQQAQKLEERNDKLRTRAKVLETMTKRLKDALMTAVLKT